MFKCHKGPWPSILINKNLSPNESNWIIWGRQWVSTHASKGQFDWRQVNSVKVYDELRTRLEQAYNYHCAFCDVYGLGFRGSMFTIEHVLPKTQFEMAAYNWNNLYPCCTVCQSKSNSAWRSKRYNPSHLLFPGKQSYEFNKYFDYDYTNNKIDVKRNLPPKLRCMAESFLEIYDLNNWGLRVTRGKALSDRARRGMLPDDDFRFI